MTLQTVTARSRKAVAMHCKIAQGRVRSAARSDTQPQPVRRHSVLDVLMACEPTCLDGSCAPYRFFLYGFFWWAAP